MTIELQTAHLLLRQRRAEDRAPFAVGPLELHVLWGLRCDASVEGKQP